MATTAKMAPEAIGDDPFGSTPAQEPPRQRYSAFDNTTFSFYTNGSPGQAKRALEAHLAETDRRLQETSELGTVLIQQRTELSDRLKEVEQQQNDDEIEPDLRRKLVELERECNEVSKDTARAFMPKNRVPSGESVDASGATVLSNDVAPSPAKLSAPSSRKQRNQQPGRVNDIKLATEISSSLLAQIRELQSVLAEKDDALKSTESDRARLEIEREGLVQRIRAMDESEQRYKDENWNLETQVREFMSTSKEAADREQRLNLTLNTTKSTKSTLERELEDLKQAHAKLTEDHSAAKKHHDVEVSNLKRNMGVADNERMSLQKKIEDLTGRNDELTLVMQTRLKAEDDAAARDAQSGSEDQANDPNASDHSPPPSPNKATPRHGQLESETLKSSLHHAHRMIQNLKNNIHREKTEKSELKRLLADAREELDAKRNGLGSAAKKQKKTKDDAFKKPARPGALGGYREAREEVVVGEPDWEDHDGPDTPSRATTAGAVAAKLPKRIDAGADTSTDTYETATENDDAFETATEREGTTTESEAFQTGAESLAGDSSDDLTETEETAAPTRTSRPGPAPIATRPIRSESFYSTASTSADEIDDVDIRTPVQAQQPKYRLKINRGGRRSTPQRSLDNSVQSHEGFQDSPASFVSQSSDRGPAGQSLFDQLGGLSDGESDEDDPTYGSRIRSRSASYAPEASFMSAVPIKPSMVDSGMMTEPWEPKQQETGVVAGATGAVGAAGAAVAGALGYSLGKNSDDSKNDDSQPVADASTAPTIESIRSLDSRPVESSKPAAPSLSTSSIIAGHSSAPVASVKPALSVSSIQAASSIQPRDLSLHPVVAPAPVVVTEYKEAPRQALSQSAMQGGQQTEPKELSVRPVPVPAPVIVSQSTPVPPQALSQSTVQAGQTTEPRDLSMKPAVIPAPVVMPTPQQSLSQSGVSNGVAAAPVSASRQVLSQSNVSAGAQSSPVAAEPVSTPRQVLSQGLVANGVQTSPIAAQLAPQEPKEIIPAPIPVSEPKEILPRKPVLAVSAISSLQMQPKAATLANSASSVVPVVAPVSVDDSAERTAPTSEPKSAGGLLGSVFGWRKPQPDQKIAEDEGASVRSGADDTGEGLLGLSDRKPLQPIATNVEKTPEPKKATEVRILADESTQTTLSADEIDKLVRSSKHTPPPVIIPPMRRDRNSVSPVRANTSSPRRAANASSPTHDTGKVIPTRRPGSAGSTRSRAGTPPPLPPDHKEVIAAAQRGSSVPGSMGPPLMPASAYRSSSSRPRTPNAAAAAQTTMSSPPSRNASAAPRARASTIRSEISGAPSRRSSVSSFASELDQRFNISRAAMGFPEDADGQPIDPRMIQAITQTMIGEYLWKYTRKAGRGDMSEKRHRRFFWVHPYTRTLYWSETDPQQAGKAQLKAKSVAISAVKVVTDDNPMPPGLHRKSIIVEAPGRNVKFTATTGQRHETWFNSLSYLLLRTGTEREDEGISAEDVSEFNPTLGHRRTPSQQTGRSRISSSTAQTTITRNRPVSRPGSRPGSRQQDGTIRASDSRTPSQPHASVGSRFSSISGMFRPGSGMRGSFMSRNSTSSKQESSIYDASTVHDSTDDLRQIIENQERDADRLENVRACCDGKHDVGSLSHASHRASSATHRHSSFNTISRSQRSRASGPGPHLHSHGEMPTDGRVEE